MKIAYFHYIYGSGTPLAHVNQFSEAARNLGHEVAVHAMNLVQPSANGNGPAHAPNTRDRLKRQFSRYLHEPKELFWNMRYARLETEILKADRPNVAVVRSHNLTIAEVLAGRATGVPVVLEVNAPAAESLRYYDEYIHIPGAGLLTERFKLRRADHILVVSEALRDHLVETHGVAPDRITVNHNGADPDRFSPDIDGRAVRNRYGLGDSTVVGFVGSFHPWHGIDVLQAVIEALAPEGVRFMTVGEGGASAEFKSWLDDHNLRDSVTFVGAIPHHEVPSHLAALDIGFVPDSNFYGSSLKLFEYMAAGKASVTPAYRPFSEVVEHGKDGLLFEPRNIDDAVDCLRRLAFDGRQRGEIARAGRAKILNGYTWHHNAERVIGACEAAVRSKAS
jgi:glycosyltransferase involved in cell wall biosynthesis